MFFKTSACPKHQLLILQTIFPHLNWAIDTEIYLAKLVICYAEWINDNSNLIYVTIKIKHKCYAGTQADTEAGRRPLPPKLKCFIIRQGEGRPRGFSVSSYRGGLSRGSTFTQALPEKDVSLFHQEQSAQLLSAVRLRQVKWGNVIMKDYYRILYTHITCCRDAQGHSRCEGKKTPNNKWLWT